MTIQEARRQAVPLMIGIAGTSGSGKTYSGLLIGAGLAGPTGKVGLLDTELGRGAMYADDPNIKEALSGGKYYISDLKEPFSPERYAQKIKEFIKFGVNVLIIDSATHEWEGFGGCQDIAENNKLRGMPNWMMAKIHHKRLMNLLTQCPMHIIFCLRARDKIKAVETVDEGTGRKKIEIAQQGLQPIQEKNFMYEMTLAMMLDFDKPGIPQITKCPKPLLHLFSGENKIITKEIGKQLKTWSDGGESVDMETRNLKRECREHAMLGMANLQAFIEGLSQKEKDFLNSDSEFRKDVRELAKEYDQQQNEEENEKEETEPEGLNLI